MVKALAATQRTISAIRKADALPTLLPGGRMRKGAYPSSGGGTTVYWAKVTGVTDANNYTVSIYDRSDESTAIETSKQCRVFDIVDSLAVNDWFPVQESSISGEDYEGLQQLGAVG